MITCDYVIKHAKTKALLRFEQPMQVAPSITREVEEKFSLMAAMCDMPDVTWQKVTACSWHLRS